MGPGLSTLLQGRRPGESEAAEFVAQPPAKPPAPAAPEALSWTLVAADVGLVTLAGWILTSGQAGVWGTAIAVAAILLGAWLGVCAFLIRR